MLSNLSLVSGLSCITKPPLPVDIVHLSGTNFLLQVLAFSYDHTHRCESSPVVVLCDACCSLDMVSVWLSLSHNVRTLSSHCIHRCGCLWQDPPYQSSLQHSDLDALTVCATCVCNSDDLFPTWPRLPFQFYSYTVTCISYFQAFQQPTAFRSFL